MERLRRETEALPYLDRAIQLDQEHVASLKLLGRVYYKMGKYQESAESLERAIELRPDQENLRAALDRVRTRLAVHDS
ncbi:MAG: tetratricopeptide repeat protein [Spirochaetia bacterium]|nr:tetratricopeptide repeat protein [Spirochaetia bacterium]